MKVHLMASVVSQAKQADLLRKAEEAIIELGHSIEVSLVDQLQERHPRAERVRAYKRNLEAIAQSDVIIAEVSYESFAVGYQIALAIEQKKPILLLQHSSSQTNPFIGGIEDTSIACEKYHSDDLRSIIAIFLNNNDIHSKDMRFNFFIDRKIYSYLRWASFKTGKTKAEILRELIKREIEDRQ